MRKILCSGSYRGSRCNRWLARVEGATLYIYCPRCRGYHAEPLTNLLGDLEEYLLYLRELQEQVEAELRATADTPVHTDSNDEAPDGLKVFG